MDSSVPRTLDRPFFSWIQRAAKFLALALVPAVAPLPDRDVHVGMYCCVGSSISAESASDAAANDDHPLVVGTVASLARFLLQISGQSAPREFFAVAYVSVILFLCQDDVSFLLLVCERLNSGKRTIQ